MQKEEAAGLLAFLAVAEEKSFTRAAGKLGVTQSALSATLRRLETRLGLRLLNRTTRSVAPTDYGERLLGTLRPAFDDVDRELAALGELREKPAGSVRITTIEHPAETILLPKLRDLLGRYPEINIELVIDYGLADIVAQRFDAGIRFGDQVAKDMIAIRIGPDMKMAVVGSPAYLANRDRPRVPSDLADHNCINMRLPTFGAFYAWEFVKNGQVVNVRVNGQMTSNRSEVVIKAASQDLGLAYVMEDQARSFIEDGRLVTVLEDWCPTFEGYHLYYPSRRQPTPAFALLVDALRYRA